MLMWTLPPLPTHCALPVMPTGHSPQPKPMADLLHPTPAEDKRKHKLKRLVQSPNSYFMDVRCPGCFAM